MDTSSKGTQPHDLTQPQDHLAERLTVAYVAARQASMLVSELSKLVDHPGDNERERIQAIVQRLIALTRRGMMAGHPDIGAEQLKIWLSGD